MAIKVGINGFGRIGRAVVRTWLGDADIDLVAVNDLTDTKTLAHLLKYDSVMGNLDHKISAGDGTITVEGDTFQGIFRKRSGGRFHWEAVGAEIVIESTGRFTNAEDAGKHLRGSVKKVIISAPAKGEDVTIVLGVNENMYDAGKPPHYFKRFVHDELPRTGRQGHSRKIRHQKRLDEHDPQLHERPAASRSAAQGPSPCPSSSFVDDPDLDRCGKGRRTRDSGTER